MSQPVAIDPPKACMFKRILIALMTAKRAAKLKYMAGWRSRNPNAKKDWDRNNKSHVKKYSSDLRKKTFAHRKLIKRAWDVKNADHVRERREAWKKENPISQRRIARRIEIKRMKKHPHIALGKRLRAVIGIYLKRVGGSKSNESSSSIIGCSQQFFRKWIESHFKHGMNFSNRHLWELDHVYPTSCCGPDENQVRLAQNYRNFRPIWKKDNREKAHNLTGESLISAFLCGIKDIYIFKETQISDALKKIAVAIGMRVLNCSFHKNKMEPA